jgi:hypothetical protein
VAIPSTKEMAADAHRILKHLVLEVLNDQFEDGFGGLHDRVVVAEDFHSTIDVLDRTWKAFLSLGGWVTLALVLMPFSIPWTPPHC